MLRSVNPEKLPAEVLGDVVRVVGAEVTLLGRLPGGVNAGAMRVQVAGRADAVLKAVPRTHSDLLHETLRAQRVVEHMRGRGYPTPAWLGVGATATHVWHLMDFVDAVPAPELTTSLVEQLMQVNELQAGQAASLTITGGTPGGSLQARRPPSPDSPGTPSQCRPWSSACCSHVQTCRRHHGRPTWSTQISTRATS